MHAAWSAERSRGAVNVLNSRQADDARPFRVYETDHRVEVRKREIPVAVALQLLPTVGGMYQTTCNVFRPIKSWTHSSPPLPKVGMLSWNVGTRAGLDTTRRAIKVRCCVV